MKEILTNTLIVAAMLSVAGVLIYYMASMSVEGKRIREDAAFCRNAIKHGLDVPTCKAPKD